MIFTILAIILVIFLGVIALQGINNSSENVSRETFESLFNDYLFNSVTFIRNEIQQMVDKNYNGDYIVSYIIGEDKITFFIVGTRSKCYSWNRKAFAILDYYLIIEETYKHIV